MLVATPLLFLLVYCTRGFECSGNGDGLLYLDKSRYPQQYQNYRRPVIKHRYHPTTYSKESSEEETPAASKPAPQVAPIIQYAYQGSDSFQQPDYTDLEIHQGEVLNHGQPQGTSGASAITPRPHPVYQQMKKPQGSPPSPSLQPGPLQSVPPALLQQLQHDGEYEAHHGYPEHEYHVQGYPDHHGFEGYHYNFPIHPPPPRKPPPPPQKSKATESTYAYYYIGRQLWYVPLYFSIYFIAYVGLLVLKSIARHKVLLPSLSEQAALGAANNRRIHENYALRSIEEGKRKYYMR